MNANVDGGDDRNDGSIAALLMWVLALDGVKRGALRRDQELFCALKMRLWLHMRV